MANGKGKKQADPVDAHVGNRVRLRRMLMGMSQTSLGSLIGVTFQQVQKYEQGVNRITGGRIHKIASVLNVSIGWFFEGLDVSVESTSPGPEPIPINLADHDSLTVCRYLPMLKPAVRRRMVALIRAMALGEDADE